MKEIDMKMIIYNHSSGPCFEDPLKNETACLRLALEEGMPRNSLSTI